MKFPILGEAEKKYVEAKETGPMWKSVPSPREQARVTCATSSLIHAHRNNPEVVNSK